MKRLIALAALLCAASACTTTTENMNTGANTNNNANAAATATATPAGVSQADIEGKERQVWDAIKAKNWDAFAAFMTDDFVLVSPDGALTKAQMMEGIRKYDMTEYSFSDVRFIKVDDDLVVLAYTTREKSSYDGKPEPDKPSYASSAWVRRNGQWLAAFHQETTAADPPQAAGGANSNTNANSNSNTPTANANANASSSPEAAEAANPIDKEKKVWEELKSKNYDAFATDLADNAIEVVPQGIMNKAGSIDGVKQFDANKYTQSDFKETKLDADASLVTYVVKSTDGKEVDHHSTIWSKRGQRWYAVLHQDTPAEKPTK
jgi:hypothetical protein